MSLTCSPPEPTALLSYLVWSEVPDLPTLLGVFIIIMSGIYVLHVKVLMSLVPLRILV